MPRGKKNPVVPESAPPEAKPKRRRSAAKASETIPLSEALAQSPIAAMLASPEPRSEPDQPMPEHEAVAAFKRQREREQATSPSMEALVTEALVESQKPKSAGEKRSHVATILAERPAFRQVPEQYFRVASHEREGIRVFKDTIIKNGQKIGVAGIQFADNRPPTEAEKQYLRDQGHRYKIEEYLWKREGVPGEALGDPTIGAVRAADELARGRQGIER
jgi:hypothetical protein